MLGRIQGTLVLQYFRFREGNGATKLWLVPIDSKRITFIWFLLDTFDKLIIYLGWPMVIKILLDGVYVIDYLSMCLYLTYFIIIVQSQFQVKKYNKNSIKIKLIAQ